MTTTTKGPDLRDYLFSKVGFTPTKEQEAILVSPYRGRALSHPSSFYPNLLKQPREDSTGLSQRTTNGRGPSSSICCKTSAHSVSLRKPRSGLILAILLLLMGPELRLKVLRTLVHSPCGPPTGYSDAKRPSSTSKHSSGSGGDALPREHGCSLQEPSRGA